MSSLDTKRTTALLGDSASRDYTSKLRHFNAFAESELKRSIDTLNVHEGARVLDAGCGTGEALSWFAELTGRTGLVAGVDLSTAHVHAARTTAPRTAVIAQADMLKPPFAPRTFDLIWCVNTINHLRDRLAGILTLVDLLRPGGRMALGQGGFLPEMYFAWDARLERVTREADRAYYLDRYGLQERDTTAVRGLVGLLRSAGLQNVQARTLVIERVAPLSKLDADYLYQTIFRDTWGERLRPYLAADDYQALQRLCDPHSPEFALRRPDFHFLQTFTLLTGGRPL
ncbi:MAG: methyltransferase domain-containing protein [Proteobacteria bacterium]|nr:methyltransferase domain-containing protein [Pseudomonadota bacterium]